MENIENQPLGSPKISDIEEYKEAEWVFQFDTEEPIVFAWSAKDETEPGEVIITLKANSNSSISFLSAKGDKGLRVYARPISEETKRFRDQEE
jgi:hypothetical protein